MKNEECGRQYLARMTQTTARVRTPNKGGFRVSVMDS